MKAIKATAPITEGATIIAVLSAQALSSTYPHHHHHHHHHHYNHHNNDKKLLLLNQKLLYSNNLSTRKCGLY